MKDEVIRFIASISGNDVTFGIVRFKVIEHGMQCGALIRLLSGLNDTIIGFALIIILSAIGFIFLYCATQAVIGDEDE